MTALLHETRDRIAFAAEGVALGAGDLLDAARERAAISVALLAALAAVGLSLTQGSATPTDGSAATRAPSASAIQAGSGATFVEERGYSLALPAGWSRSEAPDGAVFAAASADGLAESTLWVERNRDLDFDSFVTDSLSDLATLGDGARVTDRVDGPTLETSTAELRADVPLNGDAPSPYRVNLRAAGPYRYYLATSVGPGAPPGLLADAEMLGSSLRPEVELRGLEPGS